MLNYTIIEESEVKEVKLDGTLDSLTAPKIMQKVDDMIMHGARTIVFGLGKVNFISSAGLRVFIAAEKKLQKAGGSVILFEPGEQVREILRMSGFNSIFPVLNTDDELETTLGASTGWERATA